MKKKWIIPVCLFLLSCNSQKGWTEKNKQSYIETCLEENRATIGDDKVNEYCSCVQAKVQSKYENYGDIDKLSMSQNLDISNECLPQGWSSEEKTVFMTTCTDKRIEMGDTPALARTYCDCMMQKILVKYPDVNKAGSIPDEEMRTMAGECMNQRNPSPAIE